MAIEYNVENTERTLRESRLNMGIDATTTTTDTIQEFLTPLLSKFNLFSRLLTAAVVLSANLYFIRYLVFSKRVRNGTAATDIR